MYSSYRRLQGSSWSQMLQIMDRCTMWSHCCSPHHLQLDHCGSSVWCATTVCALAAWQKRVVWRQRRKERNLTNRMQCIPKLVLNTTEAAKSALSKQQASNEGLGVDLKPPGRTGILKNNEMWIQSTARGRGNHYSAECQQYIITVHPDGSTTQGIMPSVESFAEDSMHTAKPDLRGAEHHYQYGHH